MLAQSKEAQELGQRVLELEARLSEQGKKLAERDYEVIRLRTEVEAVRRTEFDLRNEIAAIRQAEQRAAAKVVGVENVTFLGYPDGRLTVNLDLRCDISRVIRQFRPGRVVAQSPERNWTRIHASHPDHMAAGEATMCAIYPDARNPFAFPELLEDGLEAWTVEQTWVMGTNNPDRYVDVTDTLDRKIAALREHVSQMPGIDDLDSLVRNWLGFNAEAAGLPAGRYAEAFRYMATA